MPDEPTFTTQPIEGTPPEGEDLQLLKRQLYAREVPPDVVARTKKLSDVPARQAEVFSPTPEAASPADFTDVLNTKRQRRKKILLWSGIGLAVVLVFSAAVGTTLWYRAQHQLKQEQINVALSAPGDFTSGSEIVYTIAYTNKSQVGWQQVGIDFEAPTGFQFTSADPTAQKQGTHYDMTVPDVSAGGSGQAIIKGHLIGQLNAAALAKATLTVSPSNAPKSQFSSTTVATTTIRSVPVDVAIEASSNAAPGQRLLAIIHVRNTSPDVLDNYYLQVNVPPGAQLVTDDAQFSADFSTNDSAWQLPALKPLDEVTRTVVFMVDGQVGEQRTLTVDVGVTQDTTKVVQREVTQVVSIQAAALTIQQTFNGKSGDQVVNAGDQMTAAINYQNAGTNGLKNAVVKVTVAGTGFDASKLKLNGGAYDPTTQTITWTAATAPGLAFLAPQQSGQVTYTFAMLPTAQFPTPKDGGKNNAVSMTATIDSADIITPLGQDRQLIADTVKLSVQTAFSLDAAVFYDDGRLGLPSTGPLPPQVGKTTTYTVRLRLGSTLNDMTDVVLIAVLPDGVSFTGKTYQTTGNVSFDDRTGQVSWKVPILTGLSGRTAPAQELDFQVSITPGQDKQGQVIAFLNSLVVSGKDTFTTQTVQGAVTDYPSTLTANKDKGTVQ